MRSRDGLFRWSSQNLTDGRKPTWHHGRAWLWTPHPVFRAEWVIGRADWGFSLTADVGGEDDLLLHFGVPFFSLFLAVGGLLPYRWLPRNSWPRLTGIRLHAEYVWLDFWHDSRGWAKGGWHWSLDWKTLLMGRRRYGKRVLSTHAVVIPMPEADYPATVTLEECTWTRDRWPGEDRRRFASVDMPDGAHGVPVPGKGENSWDCGEDGILGLHVQSSTIEEGIWAMVESAMRMRKRYGGSYDWKPRERETV